MPKFRDEDISLLVSAIRREPGRFVFLTGSGMSLSAGIPSSTWLLSEIRQKYAGELSALSPTELQNLTICMQALSPEERRSVLKPYFENPKINWAHIALACMMRANHVTQVLTFNVDTILARACGLIGLYPAIYDFGISPVIEFEYLSTPSVVHLRGQGYGSLITNVADAHDPFPSKLKPLIQYTMANSNLVVLGYDGKMDPFFAQLVESYNGRRRIYWLGHQEEPNRHLEPLLKGRHQNLVRYFGGVDSDEIMIKLAQELGCFPPDVITQPARHILTELASVTPFPLSKSNMKIDILEAARAKLRGEGGLSGASKGVGGTVGTKPEVIKREDLPSIGRNDNTGHVNLAAVPAQPVAVKPFVALTPKATVNPRDAKQPVPDHNLEKGDARDTSSSPASVRSEAQEPDIETLARSHFVSGCSYGEQAEKSEADKNLRRACEEYAQAIRIKGNFFEALSNWGICLRKLGDLRQDEKFYTHAIHKYELALKYKPDFFQALNNWAIALSELAKLRGDDSLYALSIEKYEQALSIQPDFYQALNDRSSNLASTWKLTEKDEYLRLSDDMKVPTAEYDMIQALAKGV